MLLSLLWLLLLPLLLLFPPLLLLLLLIVVDVVVVVVVVVVIVAVVVVAVDILVVSCCCGCRSGREVFVGSLLEYWEFLGNPWMRHDLRKTYSNQCICVQENRTAGPSRVAVGSGIVLPPSNALAIMNHLLD